MLISLPHRRQGQPALGERLGVAVRAARRDLVATRDRIQVASVHSIALLSAKVLCRFDGSRLDWNGFACGVGFVEAEVGA
jgi:hypothetical protein